MHKSNFQTIRVKCKLPWIYNADTGEELMLFPLASIHLSNEDTFYLVMDGKYIVQNL